MNNIIWVSAVERWRKNVISQISTCIYGKTKTKFENLRTPSCSAHHSSSRFVKDWKGYRIFFVGQCYRLPNSLEGIQSTSHLFWTSFSLLATTSKFEVESPFLLNFGLFFREYCLPEDGLGSWLVSRKKLVHFQIVNQHLW